MENGNGENSKAIFVKLDLSVKMLAINFIYGHFSNLPWKIKFKSLIKKLKILQNDLLNSHKIIAALLKFHHTCEV